MRQHIGRQIATSHFFIGAEDSRESSTGLDDLVDFQPIAVAEVELQLGLKSLLETSAVGTTDFDKSSRPALVLVRLHSQPLGLAYLDLASRNPKGHWSDIVTMLFGQSIVDHMKNVDGFGDCAAFDVWDGHPPAILECLAERRYLLSSAPFVSVIIATRERTEKLVRCLDSLKELVYPKFELLVVDNCRETDRTERALRAYADGKIDIRYLYEDERGLGAAHNRGLAEARGDIVAFTDDDVEVDQHWLAELVAPFVSVPGVGGVTGLILPAELETPAQVMLESHGRFSKGFLPRDIDLDQNRPADRLFPFTVGRLGSGANMAFDTAFLRGIGGFDPALGTGTFARGGDDLAALFRLLVAGRTLAYRPGAIVWHYHHRDFDAVVNQADGYGVGLGAYITSVGLRKPRVAASMISRLPAATLYAWRHSRASSVSVGDISSVLEGVVPQWTNALGRRQMRGILKGPIAYVKSCAVHWQYRLRTKYAAPLSHG